jgi:uncharacterized protein involved in propanediol utilization
MFLTLLEIQLLQRALIEKGISQRLQHTTIHRYFNNYLGKFMNNFGIATGAALVLAGLSFSSGEGYSSSTLALIAAGLLMLGVALYEKFIRKS